MRLRLFMPSVPITLHAGDEDVESTSDFNELVRLSKFRGEILANIS